MNAAWNHIARSIFDRADIANVSLEELDYLVEEYPYFPVVHFLRTQKVLEDKMSDSFANASRTALYFSNPHWLQFQLEGILPVENQDLPLAEILTTPSPVDELASVIPDESTLPEAELVQESTELNFDDKRIFSGSDSSLLTEIPTPVPAEDFVSEPQLPEENITETQSGPTIESDEVTHEKISIPEEAHSEDVIAVEDQVKSEPVGAEPGFIHSEEVIPAPELINNEQDKPEPELISSDQADPEITHHDQADPELPTAGVISQEEPAPGEEIVSAEDNEQDESFQVPIEPLYTIDYFASQGIRLRQEEENQSDPLSVRLKSFTEWLKAMKKIHPEKLDRNMGQDEENRIRVYAESSNEPREVYTEALAEVYLQQGLKQKAMMVFEKLSLLDPSKSAYFAARIREIKEL